MSDSESYGSGEENNNGVPVKKRANHNELERKRRQQQKDKLLELRIAIPAARIGKPSAIQILTKAKEYIDDLKSRSEELEAQLVILRQKTGLPPFSHGGQKFTLYENGNENGNGKGNMNAKGKGKGRGKAKPKGKGPKASRLEENEEFENYKTENIYLKEKLNDLKSKLSPSPSQPTSPISPGSPNLPSSPPQYEEIEVVDYQETKPKALGKTKKALTKNIKGKQSKPENHSPIEESSEESESDSTFPKDNQIKTPTIRVEDSSFISENFLPVNYKKRKSRADNDFELAKKEYHQRRNSTVEALRDHQLSITQNDFHPKPQIHDVNLLQNFAIQARRSSLPSSILEGFTLPDSDDHTY